MNQRTTLLAYIKNEDASEVLIDVIEVSKKGISYHYEGIVWNWEYLHLCTGYCVDPKGTKCQIEPLSRHFTPSWVKNCEVVISEAAKERYQHWTARTLKLQL